MANASSRQKVNNANGKNAPATAAVFVFANTHVKPTSAKTTAAETQASNATATTPRHEVALAGKPAASKNEIACHCLPVRLGQLLLDAYLKYVR
ncbi:hypothetical protein PF005_g20077 [Phytophthora fragariae]|uniref:Uncharacterized protein n=1 Tax=Phytophthora fragariae TaxID=53985 RepID=A0A6A3E7G7_9STRA|nr:hypothetical protein PF003_g11490 [Phytophthora fragariae]KAE8927841.1 hypothetical protein PF009_g21999 [Phytophthora fragariae]KAE9084176.1 hypothetical protein PF007_g21612 [Phytophthora fragariae]KAE9188381.1 hypothetical protein PF005_g20077 [Phytophthora fragariae]KAE9310087.1 hypothetical protein PF008_g20535 [Phytophthora fragariae]